MLLFGEGILGTGDTVGKTKQVGQVTIGGRKKGNTTVSAYSN